LTDSSNYIELGVPSSGVRILLRGCGTRSQGQPIFHHLRLQDFTPEPLVKLSEEISPEEG